MFSPELRDKLAKLLPLLGSDQVNEVAAAARAITRLLARDKLDWHDLVKEISAVKSNNWGFPPQEPKTQKATNGWRKSAKGNWWCKMGGYTMTVFRSTSRYAKGEWAVVIVDETGTDKTYLNDFDTIEAAQAAAEEYATPF